MNDCQNVCQVQEKSRRKQREKCHRRTPESSFKIPDSFVLFPEIFFPELCGFCLHSLKELLMVLFFLKRKVNELSWILNLGHSWVLYYNFNRILHLEKRNTGEIITTWNSKHFDKKTRVTMTRICLVWPGWYPCGSSGQPKEASDIINLKF